MKLLLKLIGALVAVAVMSSSAAAACTPVPAKQWDGTVRVGTGGWFTQSSFLNLGCSFNGQDAQMNGFDAFVADVSGYSNLSLGVLWARGGGEAVEARGNGVFYNGNCERQTFFAAEEDTPAGVTVPDGAKWVIFMPPHGTMDSKITMQSAGTTCVTKKRKKR